MKQILMIAILIGLGSCKEETPAPSGNGNATTDDEKIVIEVTCPGKCQIIYNLSVQDITNTYRIEAKAKGEHTVTVKRTDTNTSQIGVRMAVAGIIITEMNAEKSGKLYYFRK